MAAEGARRVAVLISGRGSNLGALISACAEPHFPARIVLVVSNRTEAAGLARAAAAGIAARAVDDRDFASKPAFEAALEAELRAADVEIACLAGFMRLLSADFVARWRDRLINIHPSLLPAFPGLRTHERALAAGARRHGATVHYVRAKTDAGPIIVQGAVPVHRHDTPVDLAERVLAIEHVIYPLALSLVARGAAPVVDERAEIALAERLRHPALIWPANRAG